MLTVKFIRDETDQSSQVEHSISCPHYSSQKRESGYTITLYKNFMAEPGKGVEYQIANYNPDDPGYHFHFDACFVENESGKTIAKFRAPIVENPVR